MNLKLIHTLRINSQTGKSRLHKSIFMPCLKFKNYAKFENIFYHAKMITSQNYYHANFSRLLNAKQRPEFEPAKIEELLRSSF